MKRWYSFYNEQLIKSQRPVDIFTNEEQPNALEKGQRPIGFLPMPEIFQNVPWGHHIDIICRSTTLDEALFYAKQDINKPLGVATYQLEEVVERTVKELEQHTKNN